MQRLSGNGTAFVEIDGHAMEYTLGTGQSTIVDTGYLAAMSDTCFMEIWYYVKKKYKLNREISKQLISISYL